MRHHADCSKEVFIIIYVNNWAFGAAIYQEPDGIQHPVQFVSRVLKDTESRYPRPR
ncbi:TPA: hypothetical protein N0F65_007096 [Lagenidium giganteum]|uniref:Reverse transcriptase RNase H-like domain-containing protein n=1 Tax=Lagenidium giganteum TaxID=4803 RepID=A0AAV2YHA6_9STRA|nr:TPA: hypothetical protein N0F65_007096 [Lagenidium giganteum]